VDIIYSQVTSQKAKGSSAKLGEQISSDMNFNQFLLGIKDVAIKLYNDKPIEESISLLVCNNILKLDFELISEQQLKNRFLMEALEIMKDEAMVIRLIRSPYYTQCTNCFRPFMFFTVTIRS
jgi:hypothetical protein